MNHHPFIAAPSWIHRAALLLLGLLALPLTACNAPRNYSLSTLALESVDEASRPALKLQVANLKDNDHTDANLQLAAELLTKANAEAPTSPQARAAQALVVDALPANLWLRADNAPELNRQLGITFDQVDQRMKDGQGGADLMTTMVWGRTGTTLERTDQLCAMVQRAANDPQLRNLLREDDRTRSRLWDHLSSLATHDGSSDSVLYRDRDISGDVGNSVLGIVVLPVIIIMLVLNGGFPRC